MKILVTGGHRHSGYEVVHRALVASGLAEAQPSRREGMTAAALHERVLKAHGVDPGAAQPLAQLSPGKVWEDLAVDLFLGNLDLEQWGWADPASAWLLEFWKGFDPHTRFLLVYASPGATVARALTSGDIGPELVPEVLASWACYQAEVLRFYHRNRERCVLVNSAALAGGGEPLLQRMAEALKLDLNAGSPAVQFPAALDAIPALLVGGLLEESGESQALFAELEGCAEIPEGGGGATTLAWGPAWTEYQRLTSDLRQARETLRGQAEEAARLAQRGADMARARGELQQELERAAAELARLRPLEQSLAETRRVLEQERAARIGAEAEGEARRGALEREVESLRRALGGAQDRVDEQDRQNADLVLESDLLTRQLHSVQEDLERSFLERQALAGVDGQLGEARRDLEIAKAAGVQLQARLAALAQDAETTQAEAARRLQQGEQVLNDLRAQLAAQGVALEGVRQQAAQTVAERDNLSRQAAERKAQLDALVKERDALISERNALVKERDALISERNALVKERDALISERNAVVKERDAQAQQGEQDPSNADLAQENDLLLRQLHAVQEELETYFLRYQELAGAASGGASAGTAAMRSGVPMALLDARYDMRGHIDGDNWYHPEVDGRWAGPDLVSTLNLPALGVGNYEIELDVVDAMTPEILAGTQLTLNGEPVALQRRTKPATFGRRKKRYPVQVAGRFAVNEVPLNGTWQLRFVLPKVVSPAERGSDDRRHLGIRVRSVRVAAVPAEGA